MSSDIDIKMLNDEAPASRDCLKAHQAAASFMTQYPFRTDLPDN